MARAILLGSGTSNGVPMLGVEYPPAFLANPKNHRNRACLYLRGPSGGLIVDCPPEMRLMCTAANITQIDAVLITHSHADHIMGMDDLRSICMITGRPMPVFTLPQFQADIKRVFSYAFKEFPPGVMVPRFELQDVPSVIEIGGLTVQTFLVDHGVIPCIGIRVNSFAYITDVSAIPEAAKSMLKDLDVFVVDAVRKKPHPNHFHLDQALQVAEEIGARQTYFTHLSADYDHDITNRSLPQGVELAYDGLTLEI